MARSKGRGIPAKSAAPAQAPRTAPMVRLKVDEERFPNFRANPGLERALRIRQALDKGVPREEAVRLADDAMGRAPRLEKAVREKPARPKRAAAKAHRGATVRRRS